VGAGVGKGVAEVLVGADLLGAAIATVAAFFRLLWRSTRLDPSELARRARERERKVAREGRRAAACIAGVGLVCAALAWAPWWRPRIPGTVAQAASALPAVKAAVARAARGEAPSPAGGPRPPASR
jgi:CHASE2 domain-containing sensor protein